MMRKVRLCLCAGFTASSFLLPPASAQIVRCTAPTGAVTYQEAPCPPASRSADVTILPAPSVDDQISAQDRAAASIVRARQLEAAEDAAAARAMADEAVRQRERAVALRHCIAVADQAELDAAWQASESRALRRWSATRVEQAQRVLDSAACRLP